jgi:hypothetical protein
MFWRKAMAENYGEKTQKALSMFQRYDADTQLALLWFGYLDIKDELDAPTMEAYDEPVRNLFNEIAAMPQDQQLQAQRDIVSGQSSAASQAYNAFSNNARITFWLLLGEGMDDGTIVNPPSDYQLPQETQEFSDYISQQSFEERVEFMQAAVQKMGATAKA